MMEGDYGSGIILTVKDESGAVVSLKDKTATLRFKIEGTSQERIMNVIDEDEGTVNYIWVEGEIPNPGLLEYQVIIQSEDLKLTSKKKKKRVGKVIRYEPLI
ncbi:MAG: hypothetical protein Q8M92_03830 [Candidatus Subteraquimicrobiales bacterium]|nr:hypothetical protein [Candidatus Subteraquimicrobiales bacterium]